MSSPTGPRVGCITNDRFCTLAQQERLQSSVTRNGIRTVVEGQVASQQESRQDHHHGISPAALLRNKEQAPFCITAKERHGLCDYGARRGRIVRKFKDFWQMAVRRAKPRANLVIIHTVPQVDAKKWRNSVLLVPIASAGCTCVLALGPSSRFNTPSLWMKYGDLIDESDSSLAWIEPS